MKAQKPPSGIKETITKFGEMRILKAHKYMNRGCNRFGISPLMQELMVYAGHMEYYEKCNEILARFLSIEVSSPQVYRVTDFVSEQLAKTHDSEERILSPLEKDDLLYVKALLLLKNIKEELS